MKTLRLSLATLLLIAAISCASVYTGVVTITTVVDTAMKSWSSLSVKGLTTPAVDAQVTAAHAKYRAACGVASDALQAYKASGDPTTYNVAIASAKAAATDLVNIIVPLLTSAQGTTLKTQLLNASSL